MEEQVCRLNPPALGIGIDLQLIQEISADNNLYIQRNFTKQEQQDCYSAANIQASFAGRWAAKEACIKAISNAADYQRIDQELWTKGDGASLIDIEIQRKSGHSPAVIFHGDVQSIVANANVKDIRLSITHSGDYAMAVALAL